MNVTRIVIPPTYKKENGVWTLNIEEIVLPFPIAKKSIVSIPPGKMGGNHTHAKTELFIALTQGLCLAWKKEDGTIKRVSMKQNDTIIGWIVPEGVSHVVINTSDSEGILLEIADKDVRMTTKDIVIDENEMTDLQID